MILFLDSSALAKLYLSEPQTPLVEKGVSEAKLCAVSALTLAEVAAVFYRRAHDGIINEVEHQELFRTLLEDWPKLLRVEIGNEVAREGAVLARSLGLKGADAIQLACVAMLSRERKGVRLLTFDAGLLQAATSVVKLFP